MFYINFFNAMFIFMLYWSKLSRLYDIIYPTTVTISSFSGNGRYMFHFIDRNYFEYEVKEMLNR